MFDDLLGNMKAQQEQLEIKLKTIKIVHEQDDILIDVNAAKEILNIEIADQYF